MPTTDDSGHAIHEPKDVIDESRRARNDAVASRAMAVGLRGWSMILCEQTRVLRASAERLQLERAQRISPRPPLHDPPPDPHSAP